MLRHNKNHYYYYYIYQKYLKSLLELRNSSTDLYMFSSIMVRDILCGLRIITTKVSLRPGCQYFCALTLSVTHRVQYFRRVFLNSFRTADSTRFSYYQNMLNRDFLMLRVASGWEVVIFDFSHNVPAKWSTQRASVTSRTPLSIYKSQQPKNVCGRSGL